MGFEDQKVAKGLGMGSQGRVGSLERIFTSPNRDDLFVSKSIGPRDTCNALITNKNCFPGTCDVRSVKQVNVVCVGHEDVVSTPDMTVHCRCVRFSQVTKAQLSRAIPEVPDFRPLVARTAGKCKDRSR